MSARTSPKKCLIIAAGRGSRLAARGKPKPLVPLLGLPLIQRVILTARKAGLNEFYVVTGYKGEEVRQSLDFLAARYDLRISYIKNEEWDSAGNGLSVLKSKEYLSEPFLLMMVDHLCDVEILRRLQEFPLEEGEVCLAVDRNLANPLVDLDDVTKVRIHEERIADIGKQISEYNAFDTGLFLCTPAIYAGLEQRMREHDDTSLSGGIRTLARQGKVRTMDVGSAFWIDVDDDRAMGRAEQHLLDRLKKNHDGPVSRYINRPVSAKITRYLVNLSGVTPNRVSFFSFVCCVVASLLFAAPGYLSLAFGGLLAQFASIVDGCDGEIARLKFIETKFGAWYDAVLDRYADAFLLFGLTWHIYTPTHNSLFLIVGFLAIVGSFMNSYTADKYDNLMEAKFYQGKMIRFGRDIRILLIAVGALLNVTYWLLLTLAILTNVETVRRIVVAYRNE